MRKILLGTMVLAAASAALVVGSPAKAAYLGGSCGYTTVAGTPSLQTVTGTTTPLDGAEVGVQAGGGGLDGSALAEVGACLNLPTANPADFHGGAVGVGGGPNNSTTKDPVLGVVSMGRLCGGVGGVATVTQHYPSPVGVYAIADGNNNNANLQTAGYAGVSNYEQGTTEGPQADGATVGGTCEPDDGTGTNSGGSVGVSPLVPGQPGVYVPVPFVACANQDGGPNWSGASRDGCFLDLT